MSRNETRRRPSGAYLAVCRSPDKTSGIDRGSVQVLPSSPLNIICELNFRLFSRNSIASVLPSGERMIPGSQRCMAEDAYKLCGKLQVLPPSEDSVLYSVKCELPWGLSRKNLPSSWNNAM